MIDDKAWREKSLRLVRQGREQGFVTYDDLDAALGDETAGPEDIENILAMLESAGVPVVDSERDIPQKRVSDRKRGGQPSQEALDLSHNTLEVYLREMEYYPAIKGAEENKIIEHMEEALRTMKRGLLLLPSGRESLMAFLSQKPSLSASHEILNGSYVSACEQKSPTEEFEREAERSIPHLEHMISQSSVTMSEFETVALGVLRSEDHSDDCPREPAPVSETSAEQPREMIRRGYAQLEDARRRLVEGYVRLVVRLAGRYRGRGVEFLDLVQEGNAGLLAAAKRFDPRRGRSFGTYGTWWIRQALSQAVREQGRSFRVTRSLAEQLRKLNRVRQELMHALGREPEVEELAEEMGMDHDRVLDLLRITRQPLRLDQPSSAGDDMALGDVLDLQGNSQAHDQMAHVLMARQIESALSMLDERQETVVRMRFGFDDGIPRTLDETAEKLGLDRERIRRIEEGALRNLRHPDRRNKLNAPE